MKFTVLFLAHAPDAEPEKHRAIIETGKYKLFVNVIRSQAQAIEISKKLAAEEGLHSILLCPGFSHKEVAEIQEAVGPEVAVSVGRGDAPGNRLLAEVFKKVGWH